jgi:alkylation response protein AidB-like acyl-CoA dehydrogenase
MKAARGEVVDRGQLLARASALVPVLAERALETERRRRIPDETVADLRQAGLLRIANPERYGGYGLDYDAVLEVGLELGRGCGSTAWCYTVWSSHNWLMGLYAAEAQEEYFATPDVMSSSGFNPGGGVARPAAGGYLLSGRWDFSSGSDMGRWALVAAVTPDQGPGLFVVPRDQYRVEDTWHASGLKGTGSNDVVVESAFVPQHRFLSYRAMGAIETPGRQVHDRPSYRLPAFSILPYTLAAPLVGIAQGAVDGFERRMRDRVSAFGGVRMANLVSIQCRLAEATAEVDCARLVLRGDLREMLERAAGGRAPTLEERMRYRRNHAYVTKLAVQAVNRLFEVSGGHAVFEDAPIQRAHRDVHAGSHQVALVWDTYAEQYGRVRLGLEPTDTIF